MEQRLSESNTKKGSEEAMQGNGATKVHATEASCDCSGTAMITQAAATITAVAAEEEEDNDDDKEMTKKNNERR